MKKQFKPLVITALVFTFMIAFQPEAKAWRLFGWETSSSTHTAADGKCWTDTQSDFYLFGINCGGSKAGDGFHEC